MANNNKHTGPNVPALRFPEFSGEWIESKLGDIADFSKGAGISKDQRSEEGNPCILYGELYTRYKSEVITNVFSKTALPDSELVKSKSNDIIIPASGETAEDIATARCVPFDNILLGGDLNIIRLHEQDGKFFSYQLNGVRKYDIATVAQGVSVVHLHAGDLKGITVKYPSHIAEQEKISQILGLIDDRIATQSKIIEDKETLYKAISNILFSHYANSSPTYQLGDLANLYQPETIPSTKLSRGGRYLVYGANGIIGRYDKYNHEESQICLTCRGNTCGNINFSQPYSWITGNAMVINIDNNTNNIDKRFLYHYMKNYNFTPFISGSGQPQIIRSTVEKLPVLNVNIQTQKKIASILDSIVMSIDIARKKVDMDQNVKKYLFKNLFI